MSWGYKILITYIVFIGMILTMVFIASKQTNEMQDKNYYAKELAYQSVIEGKKNLQQLPENVVIEVVDDLVKIKIPTEAASNITDGKVRFLRPSDETKDIETALLLNNEHTQLFSKKSFVTGLYKLQLNWKSNNKIYYYEGSINI